MNAEDYNRREFDRELITYDHVDELMLLCSRIMDPKPLTFVRRVERFQETLGLTADGKLGPTTSAALLEFRKRRIRWENKSRLDDLKTLIETTLVNDSLRVAATGFLVGRGVKVRASHPSWYGGTIKPVAIVWHNTDTPPGTARAMARRRMREFGSSPDDRQASWHITIETDGGIWVQVPADCLAWHAGGKHSKDLVINGRRVGHPNVYSIGIELVGFGESFTDEQVTAAARAADALVSTFKISRAGHVLHRDVNKSKNCPQKWDEYLPTVLDAVYDR